MNQIPKIEICPGLSFSRLVFGTMRLTSWGSNLSDEQIATLLDKCVDCGMTTIDTADIYGHYDCEEALGRAMALRPGMREKLTIVAKCNIVLPCDKKPENKMHMYNTECDYIVKQVESSIRNFKTSYLDVLLIHRGDPLMNPVEVAKAFSQLKQSGKVIHFGVSNFHVQKVEMLQSLLTRFNINLIANQIQVNLQHLECIEDGTLDQCIRLGISPMVWSPFGGGSIFKEDGDQRNQEIRQALHNVAHNHGDEYSIDVIILAWLLRHPSNICPIIGSTQVERLVNSCKAFELELTREEWFQIYVAARGEDIP